MSSSQPRSSAFIDRSSQYSTTLSQPPLSSSPQQQPQYQQYHAQPEHYYSSSRNSYPTSANGNGVAAAGHRDTESAHDSSLLVSLNKQHQQDLQHQSSSASASSSFTSASTSWPQQQQLPGLHNPQQPPRSGTGSLSQEGRIDLPQPSFRSQAPPHSRSLSFDRASSPLSSIVAVASQQLQQQQQQQGSGHVHSPLNEQMNVGDNSALVTDRYAQKVASPQLSVSIPDAASALRAHGSAPTSAASTRGNGYNNNGPSAQPSPPPLAPPLSSSPVPQLQPSTGSTLGSLPILSPTSPLNANSFSYSLNDNHPSADINDQLTWAAPPPLSAPGSSTEESSIRRGSVGRSAARVLSQLQIQVPPLHLSPKQSSFDLDSPRLRESPSVPRRRTIIEGPDHTRTASPVQVVVPRHSTSTDLYLEQPISPLSRSQDQQSQSEVFEYDTVTPSSPSPNPKRRLDPTTGAGILPLGRSSLSLSSRDIDGPRQGSPALSQKRSLPSPHHQPTTNTKDSSHMSAAEIIPMPLPLAMPMPSTALGQRTSTLNPLPSSSSQVSPRTQQRVISTASFASASTNGTPIAVPVPFAATAGVPRPNPVASPERSRSYAPNPPRTMQAPPQQKSSSMPTPVPAPFNPRHQSTNSASNLPAIAGLADAGPYPAAPPPIGGPSGGLAIPGASGGGRPLPRQEEVCLECMMRDRDLADVTVQGEGVWERESDVEWKDLQEREFDMMRAWTAEQSRSISGTSVDESSESQSSPRSQTSALPDEAAQRRELLRKQVRDARRAQRDDKDLQVARIGWRGFKWEEGADGESFPRGFRGTRPGALTEKGIKNVMTMYPSSSALRYQNLQSYLRGQYKQLMEVRAEAQRLGHYPEPEEPYYPTSPTLSSHESAGAYGASASSSKPRRVTQRSMDLGAPSIKAPSISTARSAPIGLVPSAPTLRQSPSTPAGLGSQVTHRSRPKTYYSDREPMPGGPAVNVAGVGASGAAPVGGAPSTRISHYKAPSGSTMPKGRESRFYADDAWSDAEDLWPPASPSSGNLRPFSFAVRAGAGGGGGGGGGGQGSDTGHSRRSFFGRFGGSVTSLFTGNTHGGSGSMMDMHLGLEADRRNRTSSYQVHDTPRVVGGLSPSRPPFTSRQSLASSVYLAGQDELQQQAQLSPRERPRSRSVSGSRLTRVSLYDDVDDEPPNKKKGLKGLLQKMKPRKREASGNLVGININPSARPEEDASTTTDLAPPPPMAFLVGHNRQRSGSSGSIGDDGSTPSLSPQTANAPGGSRSVSAPAAGSSGSGSVSPTSSRFQIDRRDDSTPGGRRRTEPTLELPPGAADPSFRGSAVMEMLSGNSPPRDTVVTPATPVYDEPQSFTRDMQMPNGHPSGMPPNQMPGGYRKSKQPSLSSRYSTSTTTVPAIETPDPAASAAYLLPHQSSSPPTTLSPNINRHKNLPPLPPPGSAPQQEAYMDYDQQSFRGSMYEQQKRMSTNTTGSAYPRSSMDPRTSMATDPRVSLAMSEAPTIHRAGIPPSADYFPTASPRYHQPQPAPNNHGGEYMPPPKPGRSLQPRASFDVLRSGRNRRGSTAVASVFVPNDELDPPSMYINRNAAASTGSFGRFFKGNETVHNSVMNSVPQTEDKKERRRGIKSIFSKRS